MITILPGDCRDVLPTLPEASAHCVVTSPPYWALRSYLPDGHPLKAREIGLEATPEDYLETMVYVFRCIWRVLRDDGTLWLNMGDCYTASGWGGDSGKSTIHTAEGSHGKSATGNVKHVKAPMLGPKQLCGMPWRLALALQADGWTLRSDIIWHKPNPMPESVSDRPTKAHEYLFLLTKSPRYYYDAEAIRESSSPDSHARRGRARNEAYAPPGQDLHKGSAGVNPKARVPTGWDTGPGSHRGLKGRYRSKQNALFSAAVVDLVDSRNKRSVWTIPTQGYSGAHFATFPEALVAPCVLAGCPVGGTVLDPFGGSGTVGRVATGLGRKSILIELNPEYIPMAKERTCVTGGLPL